MVPNTSRPDTLAVTPSGIVNAVYLRKMHRALNPNAESNLVLYIEHCDQ